MRIHKDNPAKKIYWRFYEEDIEYLSWLCKINRISRADMLHEILKVYPQANAAHIQKSSQNSP